jgi:RHS repeat-associated protein
VPTYTITYIDKLYECANSSAGTSCGKYIFAGDDRIALKNANGTFYYHPNHLGSTMAVTNASGAQVDAINYHPFGETLVTQDPKYTDFSHKYTGQELDSETGLYNYNARLYSPETGRFLTADSFIPDPTNPQSLNRYSYVLNNPLIYTDPTGHDDDWGGDGWGISFGISPGGGDSGEIITGCLYGCSGGGGGSTSTGGGGTASAGGGSSSPGSTTTGGGNNQANYGNSTSINLTNYNLQQIEGVNPDNWDTEPLLSLIDFVAVTSFPLQ